MGNLLVNNRFSNFCGFLPDGNAVVRYEELKDRYSTLVIPREDFEKGTVEIKHEEMRDHYLQWYLQDLFEKKLHPPKKSKKENVRELVIEFRYGDAGYDSLGLIFYFKSEHYESVKAWIKYWSLGIPENDGMFEQIKYLLNTEFSGELKIWAVGNYYQSDCKLLIQAYDGFELIWSEKFKDVAPFF